MPDMFGNWDRRADDDDYDARSNEIIPGLHKGEARAERREKLKVRKLSRYLSRKLKVKFGNSSGQYSVTDEGSISSSRRVDYIAEFNKRSKKFEILYEDCDEEYEPHLYELENIADNLKEAYKFSQRLKRLGIEFSENHSYAVVVKALKKGIDKKRDLFYNIDRKFKVLEKLAGGK